MTKSKKRIAIALAFFIGFFLLFSHLFISLESDHDCVGEECSICRIIEACEEIQENLISVSSMATAIVALCFAVVAVIKLNSKVYGVITPITLKTKISD